MGTAIALHGIDAGYGTERVLTGISAELPRGRVTALLGHNGSGKSTLLGVLAGLHPPSAGTVRCDGRPALVLQHTAVSAALPLSVRDAVAMGRWRRLGWWRRTAARDRAVVRDCLERVDATGLARRQFAELSGGQRQRVLIAQGLAQESGVLLLDEPAAGLDAAARERVLAIIDEITAAGTTVVHATHDDDAARRAHHCLLLERGRVRAEGRPEEVLIRRRAPR
ncbi:zinc ABC transporter ATP-binding protein AztA [Spirillospora sp. NPDC048911]|uniref:zinc ABC transporter ATP-binding protein AztA n=1 Tax=Spirillospora sp. NPDC048911 TaxID=3364527 RepID=UPI0037144B2E